jgi:hypothetical protein
VINVDDGDREISDTACFFSEEAAWEYVAAVLSDVDKWIKD